MLDNRHNLSFFTMKKLFLLLGAPLLVTSCFRLSTPEPKTFHIKGRVLAYGTNEPIANAFVSALDCSGVEYLGDDCQFVLLDTTHSDAQGRYEMNVTGWSVSMNASKPNYDSQHTLELVNGYSGEKVIDLILEPHAWLDLTITNKSGVHYAAFGVNYNQDLIIQKDSSFHFFTKVGGNTDILIGLGTIDSTGKYTDLSHYVYCKGLDTTYHSIEY
jgi:hypothetical protein